MSATHATQSDQASRVAVRVLILAFLTESASLARMVSSGPTKPSGRFPPVMHVAFLDGDAVFCHSWPYMYGLVGVPEMSKIEPAQVGLSQLPTGEGQSQSAGCLGDTTCCSSAPRRCRKKPGNSFGL